MSTDAATADRPAAPVHKGFVAIEGATVHYVRQGSGPPLVMLHAAPCSAKVMAPLQAEWAAHFTTIAFDLPGFGLSDPPADDPVETCHLADMIAEAIRALKLDRVTLYGRHTGAGVAVEIALRHPALCAFVLTDGYPVFAKPYSEARLAEYLKSIIPSWDGSHLVWCWFRYREQHMFWPWDKPGLATRADTDVPSVDFLYRGALELLEARKSYERIYASAFRHPGLAVIDALTVPVCFGNRPGDSQHKTVPLYPATARVHVFPRDGAQAAAEELNIMLEHGGGSEPPAYRSRFLTGTGDLRDYIPSSRGPVHARGYGLGQTALPLLYLHDLPGGADLHQPEMALLAQSRPVLGFDFWGNGLSTVDADFAPSIDLYADQIAEVLQFMGWDQVQIYAHGTSAAVAARFARSNPGRLSDIILRSPPAMAFPAGFADAYAPDIKPEWDGGNFLRLWHHLRDQELWWPWFDRTLDHARRTEPRIDPEDLQTRATTLLRQPVLYQRIWSAALSCDLMRELSALSTSCRVVTDPRDTFAFAARQACVSLDWVDPVDLTQSTRSDVTASARTISG